MTQITKIIQSIMLIKTSSTAQHTWTTTTCIFLNDEVFSVNIFLIGQLSNLKKKVPIGCFLTFNIIYLSLSIIEEFSHK